MKILIIEDEYSLADAIAEVLKKENFTTNIITDGEEGENEALTNVYDLILLDIMLPNKDGFKILNDLRKEKVDTPIIILTAKSEINDKLNGLKNGADDYITKPFHIKELVARVKSHLNRYERLTKNGEPQNGTEGREKDVIKIDGIEIHTRSWKVFRDGEEIRFPNREFELLKFLAMNPNIVFSKEELFEKIWGYDYVGDSVTVTVHINRIREKIEEDSKNPKIIETVWGAGYRLNR